ncbi:MAG: hypothetical protein SW833_26355 [Cyanobacteriota bacterium]|nr:hypothetical protein [Cyanobacteriota bacterium]
MVERDIEDGQKLIDALIEKEEYPLESAIWLYYPESETWKLTLASPLYDILGPRSEFAELYSLIKSMKEEININFLDTTVVSPQHPIIANLRHSQKRKGINFSGFRLRGHSINNVYVDDVYIYFVGREVRQEAIQNR